ncbi:MAG: Bug family tripartite tricarboxylate transporter substrate binding protein [Polaromonas sp.]
MLNRRAFSVMAAAMMSLISLAPASAVAQDKPPVKILVGFPPGGSVDTVARLLAEDLRVALNQTVIVENKPGAAGRIALAELKRAAPDGQTLMLVPYGTLVVIPHIYKNLAYDPNKDFTPISRVTTFGFALTAGPMFPKGDFKDAMTWMKGQPDKANYGTPGAGTPQHFAGLLFAQAAGLQLNHIAYKGGSHALQDLMGGTIPLMIDTATETIEQHKAGKLRILATTGEKREKTLPDVPTLKESGLNMPAIEGWFGLYGPAALPANDVNRLNKAVGDILRKPAIQERILAMGLTPNHAGSVELASIQSTDFMRWAGPIKASGFTAE